MGGGELTNRYVPAEVALSLRESTTQVRFFIEGVTL